MLQFIKEGEKMKRGFTLIELLGVILLLGVIAGICTPIVISMLNQSKSKVSDVQKETIEMAAKNYVNANMYNLDDTCNTKEGCLITLETLKKEGYLEAKDIKDAVSKKQITDQSVVKVSKENNKYQYDFQE